MGRPPITSTRDALAVLDTAALRAKAVEHNAWTGEALRVLCQALDDVCRVLRFVIDDAPAPVTPIRVLPGETLGDYWRRTGEASSEWARKHVVPMTPDEEA